MASKSKTMYICRECGYETVKWLGKCPNCNNWDSFDEQLVFSKKETLLAKSSLKTPSALKLSEIDPSDEHRFITDISEMDRVLGGGIVKGSVVL